MANLDRSTARVVQQLRDHGIAVAPHLLIVETAPNSGCTPGVETIVRTTRHDRRWDREHIDRLGNALRALPGHPRVLRSATQDRMTIIWAGE